MNSCSAAPSRLDLNHVTARCRRALFWARSWLSREVVREPSCGQADACNCKVCVAPRGVLGSVLGLLTWAVLVTATTAALAEPQAEMFETTVQTVFKEKCVRCHGPESRKAELDLSTPAGLVQGGESGPLWSAAGLNDSLLFDMVNDRHMPPEGEPQLTRSEIDAVRRWIQSGAHFKTRPKSAQSNAVTQVQVTPILRRRCTVCHGAVYQEAELDLRDRDSIMTGGKSGPAMVPGHSEQSSLVQRVRERLCPPEADIGEAGIEPMTPEELAVVESWIAGGAVVEKLRPDRSLGPNDPLITDEERSFWSFQPPLKTTPPAIDRPHRARNLIDRFLLARLDETGLDYSPAADRETLLRRVTFDLTGLPPSPDELDRFLNDASPQAYEKLIDRLLASPHYGERWGRYWLDLAGYADSEGKRNADTVRPWAWRYRDYVVRAWNADKPYDEFLIEQIAGDELVDYSRPELVTDQTVDKLIATGFLRMAPDGTSADPVNRLPDRIEVIADEIDVLYRGVMGLTMKCAQCHSHKYDPIPQRDYYRSVAIFKGAYDEYEWMTPQPFGNQWKKARNRFLAVVTPEQRQQIEAANAPLKERLSELNRRLKELQQLAKQALAKSKADGQVNADQQQPDQPQAKQPVELAAQIKQLQKEISQLESKKQELPLIRALWDEGHPSPTYLYRRGDEMQPAQPVIPAPPSVLFRAGQSFAVAAPEQGDAKTGRRLAFARWVTDPKHPLTSRVIVNRVWKHHFGEGLVRSVDNFGSLGTPPTHPELLNWLAVDFVEHGWNVKRLHRLLLTSAAYRQQSQVTSQHQQLDPENRLLSRMPLRRLDAEEVRDSLLQVSGRLNRSAFGQPDPVEIRKDGLVTSQEIDGRRRRSLYVRQRRKEMPTLLETFDLPQMNPNCVERKASTVVSQPLHLLNNGMIHDLSIAAAERLLETDSSERRTLVQQAWRTILSRRPTADEIEFSLKALARFEAAREAVSDTATAKSDEPSADSDGSQPLKLALADYCHALMNSAAFLYVD